MFGKIIKMFGYEKEKPQQPISVVVKNRNYVGEANWEKDKYKQFNIKIDRCLGESFSARLKENGVKLSDWFRERVNEYLSGDADE
jgi:hypothetical protein